MECAGKQPMFMPITIKTAGCHGNAGARLLRDKLLDSWLTPTHG
jgi:hypothetical protein